MSSSNAIFEQMKIESAKEGSPSLSSRFVLLVFNAIAIILASIYSPGGDSLYIGLGLIGVSTLVTIIAILSVWSDARKSISNRVDSDS